MNVELITQRITYMTVVVFFVEAYVGSNGWKFFHDTLYGFRCWKPLVGCQSIFDVSPVAKMSPLFVLVVPFHSKIGLVVVAASFSRGYMYWFSI